MSHEREGGGGRAQPAGAEVSEDKEGPGVLRADGVLKQEVENLDAISQR